MTSTTQAPLASAQAQAAPAAEKAVTLLLNWHATPYHAPIFLAQSKGFFKDEGLQVAILEPSDPSDCAALVGNGTFDLGVKALIHSIAGAAKGLPITSIGTLVDEPFTGLCYLEGSGVTQDFTSLRGKRIGYVGFFGKLQIDEIAKFYGMREEEYETVRVGMDVAGALIDGRIDAGVGLENVQIPELEEYCASVGRSKEDAKMIRIDQLAALTCCCFCSIMLIANDDFLAREPLKTAAFMRAVHRASVFVKQQPVEAWAEFKAFKKTMRTQLNQTIFERSYVYVSQHLHVVKRDYNTVTAYCKRLGVTSDDFQPNYTNDFIGWPAEPELVSPAESQLQVLAEVERVKRFGGCLSCKVAA